MLRNSTLALLLLASSAISYAAQSPITQPPGKQTTAPLPKVINDIDTLILQSQQIVLFTPKLERIDIAESIRQAMNNRGSNVILITNRENFWSQNSLTLRILYMGAKTYHLASTAQPFMVLDGTLLSGPGIQGAGTISTNPQNQQQIVQWLNTFLKTHQPLKVNDQTAEWIKRAQLGPKESDLPPKTITPLKK